MVLKYDTFYEESSASFVYNHRLRNKFLLFVLFIELLRNEIVDFFQIGLFK